MSRNPELAQAYLPALLIDNAGDIDEIVPEHWAAAEHLRRSLGQEIPEEICRLVAVPSEDDFSHPDYFPGRSAWLYHGIYALFGLSVARLLACDIAELALPLYEEHRPGDFWPRRAIETARAHARGLVNDAYLSAANDSAIHAVNRISGMDASKAPSLAASAAAVSATPYLPGGGGVLPGRVGQKVFQALSGWEHRPTWIFEQSPEKRKHWCRSVKRQTRESRIWWFDTFAPEGHREPQP